MVDKIVTVAFGDRAQLARGLLAKAPERLAHALVSALVPVCSNFAAGNGTFKALIKDGKPNAACPLQSAIAAVKGKAATAVAAAFSLVTACATQGQHDDAMLAIETAICAACAVAPRAAPAAPKVDYKAQVAALEAQVAALTIDLAAAHATISEREALPA